MKIGVPREIKPDEYRVALTPAGARELVQRGHEVLIESGAGDGSAFPDAAYAAVGAAIVPLTEVWEDAELLLKVKEPLPEEYGRIGARPRPLHVPPSRRQRRSSPGRSSTAARRVSPTRPSRPTGARYRCWRR